MGVEAGAQQSLVDLAAFKHTPANGEWYLEVMNPDPNHRICTRKLVFVTQDRRTNYFD